VRSSLVVIPHLVFAVNRKENGGLARQFAPHGKGVGCGVCGGGFAAPTNPTFPLFTGASFPQNDLLYKPTVYCRFIPTVRGEGRKWGIRGGGFAAPNPPPSSPPRDRERPISAEGPPGRFPSPQLRNSQGQPFCGLRRGGNRARISIGISTTRRSSTVPSLSRPKNRRRPIRVSGGL